MSWTVYLLYSETSRRTYIGSTTNVTRRLRQHNGEIVGGARSTRNNRPWRIYLHISGFENRSSACRWERILKCRARGLISRQLAFYGLSRGICPHGRRPYPVPSNLIYSGDIPE